MKIFNKVYVIGLAVLMMGCSISAMTENKKLELKINGVYSSVFAENKDFNIFNQDGYFVLGKEGISDELQEWRSMMSAVTNYVDRNASGETIPVEVAGKKQQRPLKEYFLGDVCYKIGNSIVVTIQRIYSGENNTAARRREILRKDPNFLKPLLDQKKIIAENKAILEKHLADISGKTLIINKEKKMDTCKILIALLSMFDRAINKIKADADSFVRG